jgi:hypothetical protein
MLKPGKPAGQGTITVRKSPARMGWGWDKGAYINEKFTK